LANSENKDSPLDDGDRRRVYPVEATSRLVGNELYAATQLQNAGIFVGALHLARDSKARAAWPVLTWKK